MKLKLNVRQLRSKLWEWQYTDSIGKYFAGLCISKRDALNDGSIQAGFRWEQATDDMQTAQLTGGFILCCTRGLDADKRVTWELIILDEDKGLEQSKSNVFDNETEAKCCAPKFLHKWREEQAAKIAAKPTTEDFRIALQELCQSTERILDDIKREGRITKTNAKAYRLANEHARKLCNA